MVHQLPDLIMDLTKLTNDEIVGHLQMAQMSIANLRRDRCYPEAFVDVMAEVKALQAEIERRHPTV